MPGKPTGKLQINLVTKDVLIKGDSKWIKTYVPSKYKNLDYNIPPNGEDRRNSHGSTCNICIYVNRIVKQDPLIIVMNTTHCWLKQAKESEKSAT